MQPTTRRPLVSWLDIPEVGEELLREGWPHFVEAHVRREIDWFAAGGVRASRFILHDPGVMDPTHPRAFGQWLDDADNRPRLCEGFDEAWEPVIDAGHEVICYLGPLRWTGDADRDPYNPRGLNDPSFAELAMAQGRAGEWFDRATRAVAPALAGRCSVAFESLAQVTPRHPACHLVGLLQTQGTRCYVEPMPHVTEDGAFAHWYGVPKIVAENAFDRANLPTYARHFGDAELIRACVTPAAGRDEQARRIIRILEDGHTAAFRVYGAAGGKAHGVADLGLSCKDLVSTAAVANTTSAPADSF